RPLMHDEKGHEDLVRFFLFFLLQGADMMHLGLPEAPCRVDQKRSDLCSFDEGWFEHEVSSRATLLTKPSLFPIAFFSFCPLFPGIFPSFANLSRLIHLSFLH